MTVTLTVHALTTLDTIKDELNISVSDNSQDSVLTRLVNAASEAIERFCCRHFEHETEITEKIAGQGGKILLLSRTPLVEITEVKINDAAVTDYSIYDSKAGMLFRANGWPWSGSAASPFSPDPLPGTERQNIETKYTGGYVTPAQESAAASETPSVVLPRTLPYDLEQFCIDTVVSWYRQRGEDKSIVAEKLMSASVQYDRRAGNLPASVAEGLRRYVRII